MHTFLYAIEQCYIAMLYSKIIMNHVTYSILWLPLTFENTIYQLPRCQMRFLGELQNSAGLKVITCQNFEMTLEQTAILTRKLQLTLASTCDTVFLDSKFQIDSSWNKGAYYTAWMHYDLKGKEKISSKFPSWFQLRKPPYRSGSHAW